MKTKLLILFSFLSVLAKAQTLDTSIINNVYPGNFTAQSTQNVMLIMADSIRNATHIGSNSWSLTGNAGTTYDPQAMVQWIGATDDPTSGIGFGLDAEHPCGNIDNGSVYFGVNSGYSDNTFHDNQSVGIGANALYSNPSDYGGANAAVGWNALYSNVNGYYNVANGANAGQPNVNGYANTYDGAYTGNGTANSNNCTFIGYSAGADADHTNSTGLGAGSTITADNQMVFGNGAITSNVFTGDFTMNGDAGTSGYVLTSQGAGTSPVWNAPYSPVYTLNQQSGTTYTILPLAFTKNIIIVLTNTASITVTMPDPSIVNTGMPVIIKAPNVTSTNTLTINPFSTETIDNQSSIVIVSTGTGVQPMLKIITLDNVNWIIIP